MESDLHDSSTFYNPVLEKLVGQEGADASVQGLIAYGMYKISKRQWVTDFKIQNRRPPTQIESQQFASSQTETVLAGYRAQAAELLADYAGAILAEEKPKIEKEALRGMFWSAVLSSIVASFLFALILLGFAVVAAFLGYGLPLQINIPRVNS